MSHATCTQGRQGDSRFLVVKSQIIKLTLAFLLALTCVLMTQMGHVSPF
jgi:hypothetical protein